MRVPVHGLMAVVLALGATAHAETKLEQLKREAAAKRAAAAAAAATTKQPATPTPTATTPPATTTAPVATTPPATTATAKPVTSATAAATAKPPATTAAPVATAAAPAPSASAAAVPAELAALQATRADRRAESVKSIRARWGALVENPAARDELRRHAKEVAYLQRARLVADKDKQPAIVAKVDTLLTTEETRHGNTMNALRDGAPTAAVKTP